MGGRMAKKQGQKHQKGIPIAVEHMLHSAGDPGLREDIARFWADPKRGERYDARFSELLASLPADAIPGLAEACENYIRAWGSGGGSYKVERSVYDAATTNYPRVLAVNIYRGLQAVDMDKTEAYCLIVSIFEDTMEETGGMWPLDAA